MMPARLLWPWEVLEIDVQDMKKVSSAGSRYLLVVVDRASRFFFAYPFGSKDYVGVARKLFGAYAHGRGADVDKERCRGGVYG